MAMLTFLCFVTTGFIFQGVICQIKVINVDPINGEDSKVCMYNSSESRCRSLDYVLVSVKGNLNSTVLFLYPGEHFVLEKAEFYYVSNFQVKSLAGEERTLVLCRGNNTGISFEFSQGIVISGITITNCASRHKVSTANSSVDYPWMSIAFYIGFSSNIIMENSSFVDNYGVALSMYRVYGHVSIVNCKFSNNTDFYLTKHSGSNSSYHWFTSGGGLHVTLDETFAYYSSKCTSTPRSCNDSVLYELSNCSFSDNIAENDYVASVDRPYSTYGYLLHGKGGGVLVSFLGRASRGRIAFKKCYFHNNKALWGGGLFVSFHAESNLNEITIEDSTFTLNNGTFGGGGIRIESNAQDILKMNVVSMSRTKFLYNAAMFGGGFSLGASTRGYKLNPSDIQELVGFESCSFIGNTATVGFAIGLSNKNSQQNLIDDGLSWNVALCDCVFQNSRMMPSEDHEVIGHGAIYSDEVTLILGGKNSFSNNTNSAVVLDNASLIVRKHSIVNFTLNSGIVGGAIALYGNSWIMLQRGCFVKFEENSASTKGGALYYKPSVPPRLAFQTTELQMAECFLRYEDKQLNPQLWPVTVEFINNFAPNAGGNSIYATTLQFCRMPGEKRSKTAALTWNFIKYKNTDSQPEIATNAVEIHMNASQWNVYRDFPFSPDVILTDETGHNVYGTIRVDIDSTSRDPTNEVTFVPPNDLFFVKDHISDLRIRSLNGTSYNVNVMTTAGQHISTSFQANLGGCPVGYYKNNGSCTCLDHELGSGVIDCSSDGKVYLLKGYWAGISKRTGELFTLPCPSHYCQCYHEQKKYICEYSIQNQCSGFREGILCSQCRHGMSVLIGNEDCRKCSNIYLLLLLPMVVVASLFVMIILYFNIDAFSGYLNAFLYTYQMIPLILPENVPLDGFIDFVIGLTGLTGTGGSFGVCLFNGFDNMDKLVFNYALPFFMIFITIVMGSWIPEKAWHFVFYRSQPTDEIEAESRRRSFGRALSFVCVICYSSFTSVTLYLLHPITVDDEWVLYRAGNVRYFEGKHIPFAILAILVLIFVVLLFPVVLLFTPFFTYHFGFVQRLEPVLNTLKNCFKDNNVLRSFAAFYFICRFGLLLIYVFIPGGVFRLVCLSIASVLYQSFFSWVQPYKLWTNNLWDILLLTNMSMICLLCLILSVPFSTTEHVRTILSGTVHILVYLPLLSVVVRFLVFLHEKKTGRYLSNRVDGGPFLTKKVKRPRSKLRYRENHDANVILPHRVTEDFESEYVEYSGHS